MLIEYILFGIEFRYELLGSCWMDDIQALLYTPYSSLKLFKIIKYNFRYISHQDTSFHSLSSIW